MPGSVSLAVKAAFRSGSGKVSLLAPEKLKRDLHKKIWELMSLPAFPEDLGCLSTEHLSIWEKNQTRYQAAAIGPGMESADESRHVPESSKHFAAEQAVAGRAA
jgi:NAD(P)H-hydrate repair Nnr-like enzyme with NAD(P)H-hydrate dehydratase domain